MWKTLYDMFGGEPNEQELYHAIATVGTLLLEIGEVGKKFYLQREDATSSINDSNESASETGSLSLSSVPEIRDDTASLEAYKNDSDNKADAAVGSGDAVVENATKQLDKLNLDSIDKELDQTPESEKSDQISDMSAARSGLSLGNLQRGERTISSSSSKVDIDWSISFEQFLASMLTEPALVKYFEQRIDLQEAVDKTRNRRLLMRQQSAPFESLKPS